MRKLKTIKTQQTKSSLTTTKDDMLFFGITAVCKKAVIDYIMLLIDAKDFVIDAKILEMIIKVDELLEMIMVLCTKKSWTDLEILQVKSKSSDYFPYLEALTKIRTAEDVEKARIYVQDYELITSLVTAREYYKEIMAVENNNINPQIVEYLRKIIYRFNHIIKYYLNEIFFGNPPKVDKKSQREPMIIELQILIDNSGRLINRKGYYEKFMIKDENETLYCAGLADDGRLVVLNQDDGSSILNLNGEKLKWKNTLKIKSDSMNGIYKYGNSEVVTNMRRFQYQELLKECEKSQIHNIEIIKTLIEMSGFAVLRD